MDREELRETDRETERLEALALAKYPILENEKTYSEVRSARNAIRKGFKEGYREASSADTVPISADRKSVWIDGFGLLPIDYSDGRHARLVSTLRHFEILAEAMAEVKAVADGQSDQPLSEIVKGCVREIRALPLTEPEDGKESADYVLGFYHGHKFGLGEMRRVSGKIARKR